MFIIRLLLLSILLTCCVQAKSVNVLFVPPGEVRYWKDVTVPMIPAAKRLNLNLIINPIGNTEEDDYERQVLALIESTPNIDWLIWSQRRIATKKILEALKQHNIRSIDITSGLFKDVQAQTGYPQQHYKNWMAQVVTDEFQGGQRLATELIALRRATAPSLKEVKLVGLAGNKRVASTMENVSGLRAAVGNDNQASLMQVVNMNWNMEDAKRMTHQLFLRYQSFDVIWAGNTSISQGAVARLNEMKFNTRPKPVVGNLGWSIGTIEAVKSGQLAFSFGGNHLNGLWALIVIHDIENGVGLPSDPTHTLIKAPYTKLTKDNVALIEPYFTASQWEKANIKQFSKVYNPKLTHYNFDFSLLLK